MLSSHVAPACGPQPSDTPRADAAVHVEHGVGSRRPTPRCGLEVGQVSTSSREHSRLSKIIGPYTYAISDIDANLMKIRANKYYTRYVYLSRFTLRMSVQ